MGQPAMILNINDYDPTGTLHIRDQFAGKMRRAFRWLRGRVNYALIERNAFGIIGNVEIAPEQFRFNLDRDKIQAFMDWFVNEMSVGIIEGGAVFIEGGRYYQEGWMDQYLKAAYEKGVIRARKEMADAGYPVQTIEQAGGVEAVMAQEVHINRTALIYMRAYEELKGITSVTGQKISRELADGMAQGLHPREMASNINKNIEGITKQRATLLARTETIRSHHMANMAEYRQAQVMGIKIKAEFQTAGHGVCEKCLELERRNPYTLDEAEKLIPVHPNCFIDFQIPIYTSEGWKQIGNIRNGDLVLTHKGRFKKVYATPRKKRKGTKVVSFSSFSGKTLSMTIDHLVLAQTKDGKEEWIKAGEFKKDSMKMMVMASRCARCNKKIPLFRKYCSRRCLSLDITDRQWSDPEHRENVSNHEGEYEFVEFEIKQMKFYTVKDNRWLYNLSVEDDESYVAKGVVVHNCRCVALPLLEK